MFQVRLYNTAEPVVYIAVLPGLNCRAKFMGPAKAMSPSNFCTRYQLTFLHVVKKKNTNSRFPRPYIFIHGSG